jgi:hypothetical protein
MSKTRALMLGALLFIGLLLAACGGASSPPTADPQRTVEAILTQTARAEGEIATRVAATIAANSQQPTATPTPSLTAPPKTPEPVSTATPPPEPTVTPVVFEIAESAVDGDDGNDFIRGSSDTNQGRVILLPGFQQSQVSDPMVFDDLIVFGVEVFDTRAGLNDGAGIREVIFRIEPDDGSGQVLFENRLEHPPYCVFGAGEIGCAALYIDRPGERWPGSSGAEILNGQYLARIDIFPTEGEATQWRWRFQVDSPLLGGLPTPNTAAIKGISLQSGVYYVDFETYGFEPLVEPGKLHVHFFFNTVPPEQAGVPGQGPWKLYPSGPGQPNTSPFTHYTAADRPEGATQMCILVANYDHSVNLGTGNCVDLPGP